MLAVRVALSNPEKADARETYLQDHKRHLRSGRLRIVQSGPILDEAGEGSGGVVVADVVSLEEMHRFSAEDPFVLHGVYSSVSIHEWRPTISDRG
ncbi:YciI family protein [Rhizobium jaguaris]|uniref:YciI family protein n=1 Tax=Rhizobium jaguaris TaxID=1312183 RepID=A0A387FXR5_9HYPH|nr:YciI family protein [Rhizobium jaguaris]AYG62537.1 YciI family protein [Rhizobium jaguaris]